jgi:DNA-binding PadR family transcriptional regulator
MGHLETGAKKRLRRGQIERIILGTLAVSGIAMLALAAPKTLALLKHADPHWMQKCDPRQRLYVIASRLKRKGLVVFERASSGNTRMQLTEKGRRAAEHATLGDPLPRAKKWDGMWRILMFDIPEKHRRMRDRVRTILSGFGFVLLQDSVWVFPYDCEDTITLLKTELRLGSKLLYVIAHAIENDKRLRKHFDLPPSA